MKTAMILAAGRGERLKPLTDYVPKAMCSVQGKPLIEHHVLNLAKAGFERIVINHAYLGGQIRHHLGNGSRFDVEIFYSPEPPGGLETGGGIVNALPLLGQNPFLTVNADIYTDFDFASLNINISNHLHLILTNNNPKLEHYGDFGFINNNTVSNERIYTYAGIACYHPKFFDKCKIGRYSVLSMIRQCVEKGNTTGTLYQGSWFDIGSLQRLDAANER